MDREVRKGLRTEVRSLLHTHSMPGWGSCKSGWWTAGLERFVEIVGDPEAGTTGGTAARCGQLGTGRAEVRDGVAVPGTRPSLSELLAPYCRVLDQETGRIGETGFSRHEAPFPRRTALRYRGDGGDL